MIQFMSEASNMNDPFMRKTLRKKPDNEIDATCPPGIIWVCIPDIITFTFFRTRFVDKKRYFVYGGMHNAPITRIITMNSFASISLMDLHYSSSLSIKFI